MSEERRVFYVDCPDPSKVDEEDSWVNLRAVGSREAAIGFCKRAFGADEEGRVSLVTEGREEGGRRRHCGKCHACGGELRSCLDGEEWCPRCGAYRRYRSHGWSAPLGSGGDCCPDGGEG